MRLVDDPAREFSMTFNCETKELALYELEKKNCGRVTGKFVRSDRYYNPEATDDIPEGQSGRYYKASDFYVGAVMKLHTANVMEVVDLDESSLNYMEGDPKSFPLSDYQGFVAPKVLRNLVQGPAQGRDLRQELLAHDREGRASCQARPPRRRCGRAGAPGGADRPRAGHRLPAVRREGAGGRPAGRGTPHAAARAGLCVAALPGLAGAGAPAGGGLRGALGLPRPAVRGPAALAPAARPGGPGEHRSMPLDGLDALFSVAPPEVHPARAGGDLPAVCHSGGPGGLQRLLRRHLPGHLSLRKP
ncbi:unnamed protein product [Heterosigma akashiwo]